MGDIGKDFKRKKVGIESKWRQQKMNTKINIKEKNKIDKIKIFVFKICVN